MLAQILAIAVAMGSSLFFLTAFIFPKLHRQDDFFWSAVGLFYALVLWVCAGQMAGAILLAQLASVVLLGWFAWETLRLRQAIADPTKIPDLDQVSLIAYVKERFKPKKAAPPKATKPEVKPATPDADTTPAPETEAAETVVADPIAPEVIDTEAPATAPEPPVMAEKVSEVSELPEPEEITDTEQEAISEPPITAQPSKKGFSLGRLFGKKAATVSDDKQASGASDAINDEAEIDDIFGEAEPEVIAEPEKILEISDEVLFAENTASEDVEATEPETEQSQETEDPPKETP